MLIMKYSGLLLVSETIRDGPRTTDTNVNRESKTGSQSLLHSIRGVQTLFQRIFAIAPTQSLPTVSVLSTVFPRIRNAIRPMLQASSSKAITTRKLISTASLANLLRKSRRVSDLSLSIVDRWCFNKSSIICTGVKSRDASILMVLDTSILDCGTHRIRHLGCYSVDAFLA
jgi:hypothetical protein